MSQFAPASDTSELSVKLNELVDIMLEPSQPPSSNAACLWQMRAGTKTNPTMAHPRALDSLRAMVDHARRLEQLPPVRASEG